MFNQFQISNLISLLFYILNCVHCNVPNPSPYFNQTIIHFKNESIINRSFVKQSTIKKSFQNSLIQSSTSLSVLNTDHNEFLPKPEARVQQTQHTRSRTGSTTIDLTDSKFNRPSLQYLNQTKASSDAITYITKNNEILTVNKQIKQANKVIDLHIGALFPMTSSHSSGWLGGQGCKLMF